MQSASAGGSTSKRLIAMVPAKDLDKPGASAALVAAVKAKLPAPRVTGPGHGDLERPDAGTIPSAS